MSCFAAALIGFVGVLALAFALLQYPRRGRTIKDPPKRSRRYD